MSEQPNQQPDPGQEQPPLVGNPPMGDPEYAPEDGEEQGTEQPDPDGDSEQPTG